MLQFLTKQTYLDLYWRLGRMAVSPPRLLPSLWASCNSKVWSNAKGIPISINRDFIIGYCSILCPYSYFHFLDKLLSEDTWKNLTNRPVSRKVTLMKWNECWNKQIFRIITGVFGLSLLCLSWRNRFKRWKMVWTPAQL